MHQLTRFVEFEASHRYWKDTFSEEENLRRFGKCVSLYGHGHNYRLRVTVEGSMDAQTGMVLNIKDLDHSLREVTKEFDHKFINLDHPAFKTQVPTTENISAYIRNVLEQSLHQTNSPARVFRVRLYEDPTLWSDVTGGEGRNMASLTKTFSFSAAHRLHSRFLSDEKNQEVFGKCNNLHGHGHNYELEVTVTGPIAEQTGMVFDLGELMQIVQEEVIERFDHKHLNLETEEFRDLNPTGENIAQIVWNLLKPRLGNSLSAIGLWETPKNFFEYRGETLSQNT